MSDQGLPPSRRSAALEQCWGAAVTAFTAAVTDTAQRSGAAWLLDDLPLRPDQRLPASPCVDAREDATVELTSGGSFDEATVTQAATQVGHDVVDLLLDLLMAQLVGTSELVRLDQLATKDDGARTVWLLRRTPPTRYPAPHVTRRLQVERPELGISFPQDSLKAWSSAWTAPALTWDHHRHQDQVVLIATASMTPHLARDADVRHAE